MKKIIALNLLINLALSAPNATLNCNPLPANTICGTAYAGFPVNNAAEVFNSNLQNFVANSTYIAASLYQNNICNSTDVFSAIMTLRYQVSFQCSYFVHSAIQAGCPVPSNTAQTNGPLLCPRQCNLAVNTVQNLASNITVCPGGASSISVPAYASFCSSLNTLIPQNQNLCNTGSTAESQFCGFSDKATASTQCELLVDDACCKDFLVSLRSSSTYSITSNKPLFLSLVVIGALLALACLAGLCFYFYRKNRSAPLQKRTSFREAFQKTDYFKNPPPLPFVPASLEDETTESMSRGKSRLPSFNQSTASFDANCVVSDIFVKQSAKSRGQSMASTRYSKTKSGGSELFKNHVSINFDGSRPHSEAPSGFGGKGRNLSEFREVTVALDDMPAGTKVLKIIHSYESNLDDELTLIPGSIVYKIRDFDDGWALGVNPYDGSQGAFPLVCVDTSSKASRISKLHGLDRDSISVRNSSVGINASRASGSRDTNAGGMSIYSKIF